MTLSKPRHGEPCNNCGLCCLNEPCMLGQLVLKQEDGACQALEIAPRGGYACGLVAHPERYAPVRTAAAGAAAMRNAARVLIGSGIGCDAQLEGEPASAALEQRLEDFKQKFGRLVGDALWLWGASG